jgi:prepilin-type N-terminal cleavage/methylation domain-containing protein
MSGKRGFTLIEVLAAIAILGVSLFVLLQSQWSALNIHATMNEEVTLGELVETVAGKAEIGVLTGVVNDAGDFGTRYPEYTWMYDAALRGDTEDPENQLYEVIITIEGPESEKSLKFYVYNNNPENNEGGLFSEGGAGNQGNTRGGQGGRGAGGRSGGGLF